MPVIIEPTAYYSEQEVAGLLEISPETLRKKRVKSSDLPFCKYGRRIFYRGDDLIRMLDATRRRSTRDVKTAIDSKKA